MTERIRQNVIIPQVNEPLGHADGKPVFPTVAWQQYFEGLWKRTGGFSDAVLEALIRSLISAEESLLSVDDALNRLRRVEDNLRADVESTLASLGELARVDAASRQDIGRGAIGNQGNGFTASHTIRTLPSTTPANANGYTALIRRTGYFLIAPNSTTVINVSFQFRAPSDLFDWFFYKYALRLEAETVGGTQTFIGAPVATRRKGEWVSGSMASANYDRVEPFALQYQFTDADITAVSGTGRYRVAFDIEPDNSVNSACVEGWGTTVTGTFAWQNVSLEAIALNQGPIGG